MDETYGTYVDDECFDIHDYDDDTDHHVANDTEYDTDDADDDSGICIQSRLKDQRPCPGMNEHPRRDMDVILRQSKAPLELFNSR